MLYKFMFFIGLYLVLASVEADTQVVMAFEDDEYRGELLALALSYSPDKHYQLSSYPKVLPTLRAYRHLSQVGEIDVMSGTSTKLRESQYLAIKFPINKGISGWRIPVINSKNKNLLENVNSVNDLKSKQAGLFHLWTDVAILEANSLPVSKVSNFEGIFEMVDKGRIDYFPQSALAALKNINARPKLSLMIDPHLVIRYPTAVYFYVNKQNTILAKDIKKGLELALKDGSFDMLFNDYFAKALKKLNLKHKKIINLKNPYLGESVPFERAELWYHQ